MDPESAILCFGGNGKLTFNRYRLYVQNNAMISSRTYMPAPILPAPIFSKEGFPFKLFLRVRALKKIEQFLPFFCVTFMTLYLKERFLILKYKLGKTEIITNKHTRSDWEQLLVHWLNQNSPRSSAFIINLNIPVYGGLKYPSNLAQSVLYLSSKLFILLTAVSDCFPYSVVSV